MSHAMTFDTLAVVKILEASGIGHKQSEGITEAMANIFDKTLNTVATKNDINQLDTKIDKMASEFDAKLSKQKSEIIMWIVGILFAQTAFLSLIKFMH